VVLVLRRHVRSLYLKVLIPIVALVLAAIGLMSYFAMRTMREGVATVAAERARYGLAYVRDTVEDVGSRNMVDRAHLQTSLERLNLSPDIDTARIISLAGRVLYSSKANEVGQLIPVHLAATRDSDDLLEAVDGRPDLLRGSGRILNQPHCAACHGDRPVLAFADVDISMSRQSAGMKTWGAMATVAAIAQFVVIGAGVAVILGVVVVRPIRRLSASMSQVQHGNLSIAASAAGTTEIDALVGGFNDMVARLRHARAVEQEAQRGHMARVEQLATLGEVAASLAHEIRNPLAGTKAAVDILASEETSEEPRRILRHVSEELKRVDGVVRQLMNFAKPKTPVLTTVDLRTLLDDAILLSGPRAATQGVTLQIPRPAEPLDVQADADMVLQVLVNLIINAIQATHGTADAHVTVSTAMDGAMAACTIRDSGPGVPADRADAIFRPFVTTKREGTGLGLATSRRLIELHGGRLRLDNPGQPGASFTFTLRTSASRVQKTA
jgi:signal transduction histidine kinase